MKSFAITIVFTLLCVLSAVSQISNEERLEQIEQEIAVAVEASDFERAAELKKEREIRLEIKEAIENKDFGRAAELKSQIADNSIERSDVPEPKTREPMHDKTQPHNTRPQSTSAPSISSRSVNRTWYPSRSGMYMDGTIGNLRVAAGFNAYNSIGGGARGGWKFYFGSKENRTRVGLDIMVCSGITSEFGTDVAIVNPGFTLATAFTKNTGFEFGFVTGPQLFVNYFLDQDVLAGLTINPQFKFRFAFIDLGAQLIYSSALGNNLNTLFVGAIAGFKFYKTQ